MMMASKAGAKNKELWAAWKNGQFFKWLKKTAMTENKNKCFVKPGLLVTCPE